MCIKTCCFRSKQQLILKAKETFNSSLVKWPCLESRASTIVPLNPCLRICLWKIFSSIVPVVINLCINRTAKFLKIQEFGLTTIGVFKPVNLHRSLLSFSPNSSHGLHIISWVPIDVIKYETRSSDQIQTNTTSFRAQQKNS